MRYIGLSTILKEKGKIVKTNNPIPLDGYGVFRVLDQNKPILLK